MIHKTAVVESGAELGSNVTVGPFAYIEGDVRIGDGCVIGPHASVLRYTTLGQGCRLHANAVVGDWPQDLGFRGTKSGVTVGDRCTFRESVTIHRGTKPDSVTVIGNDCFLMAYSHVAHNVSLGNGVIIANGTPLGGYVEVGDKVFISGLCLVHQFVRIGRLAMLGGGSGVSKDVPPFCTMRPQTPNVILGLNVVGMRRAGMSVEDRKQVKDAFRTLYFSGLNIGQAIQKIREAYRVGPAVEMVEFVEKSKRGICAPDRSETPDMGGDPD